jgi:hypothetical protein
MECRNPLNRTGRWQSRLHRPRRPGAVSRQGAVKILFARLLLRRSAWRQLRLSNACSVGEPRVGEAPSEATWPDLLSRPAGTGAPGSRAAIRQRELLDAFFCLSLTIDLYPAARRF